VAHMTDREFADAFRLSFGLCLPHLSQAVAAPAPNSTNTSGSSTIDIWPNHVERKRPPGDELSNYSLANRRSSVPTANPRAAHPNPRNLRGPQPTHRSRPNGSRGIRTLC
jgi:hypothetical protein